MSTRLPDDTDREILRLLAKNVRRLYCEIAKQFNLSARAASDLASRLREHGIFRRFTLDIDRSPLQDAVPILVRVEPELAAVDAFQKTFFEVEDVENVFTMEDSEIVFSATPP